MNALLSVTFACGVIIAGAHVLNRRFIAPVYDVLANLIAFGCATAASGLMHHWVPAAFAASAVACWCLLGHRTMCVKRRGLEAVGQQQFVSPRQPAR